MVGIESVKDDPAEEQEKYLAMWWKPSVPNSQPVPGGVPIGGGVYIW